MLLRLLLALRLTTIFPAVAAACSKRAEVDVQPWNGTSRRQGFELDRMGSLLGMYGVGAREFTHGLTGPNLSTG